MPTQNVCHIVGMLKSSRQRNEVTDDIKWGTGETKTSP